MKKWLCLCILSSTYASAYTPALETILGEAAQNCIAGSAQFQAVKSIKEEKVFLSLTLKNGGLFSSEHEGTEKNEDRISLYFLSELLNCKAGHHNVVEQLKEYLVSASVDIKKISHYLFENEPVFIIGAQPSERSSPQIWIEKKNFLPVKEIIKNRTTVFGKWTTINSLGQKKFPSFITTTEDNVQESVACSEKISWTSGG